VARATPGVASDSDEPQSQARSAPKPKARDEKFKQHARHASFNKPPTEHDGSRPSPALNSVDSLRR
jgi:hypothetical protein